MIFVKSELTPVIRNVEATSRKVGRTLRVLSRRTHAFSFPTDRTAGNVW